MAVLRDIVFAEHPGFRPISLDLRLPGAAGAPLIVFVHGGGWRVGSRASFGPEFPGEAPFDEIVDAGFAVASVDYRLSSEAPFPAPRDDVSLAVAWLIAHADDYSYDATRVVLWGESAGATLAALVGLAPGATLRGVIDWYGPANLLMRGAPAGSREAEFLGGTADQVPDRALAASPVFQVHPAAPPFYIAHGDADEFVDVAHSRELAEALAAQGVSVRFDEISGANHMWRGAVDRPAVLRAAIDFAASVT